MRPLRCQPCGRLLAKRSADQTGDIEIACPRCKAVNRFTERHERPSKGRAGGGGIPSR